MVRMSLIGTVTAIMLSVQAAAQSDYVDSAALREAGWVKQWQLQLPLASGQQIADAYLVDDQLYFGTMDGYVFAVDAQTGALRWTHLFTTGGYRLTRPAHIGIRTLIATPPAIVQYDKQYGTPIRKIDLRFPAGTPAVSDGKYMLIGGLDRRLYSFNINRDFERWKVGTDSQIVSRPTVMGEYVYFASDRGRIYSCKTKNKAFHWINRSIGPVSADLVADENGLYVASRNWSLYLLDPEFGRSRWRARLSGPLYEPPVPTKELAYQFSPAEGLVAVETAVVGIENRIRWKLARGRSLLNLHDKTAYVLSLDENLLAVSTDNGTVKQEFPVPGMTLVIPTPGRPEMYLASVDGRIFCARRKDVPLVTAKQVVAALGKKETTEQQPREKPPATSQPSDLPGLRSGLLGPPIGGKSKVSKQFQQGAKTTP